MDNPLLFLGSLRGLAAVSGRVRHVYRSIHRPPKLEYSRLPRLGVLGLLLIVRIGVAGSVLASERPDQADPFATWKRTAERAQAALKNDRASTSYLERLRDQLAEERSEALKISESTDVSVKALQAQLDALGPAPGEGEQEANLLSNQRSQLLLEIGEASAPLLEANGAFQRADVLIKELDRLIRDRHAADLLARYPSAVFVQRWPATLAEIGQWTHTIGVDTYRGFLNPNSGVSLYDGLPISLAIAALGFFLLPTYCLSPPGKRTRCGSPSPKVPTRSGLP